MLRSRSRALVALAGAATVVAAWGCNALLGLDDVDRSVRDEGEGGTRDGDIDDAAVDGSLAATPGACLADVDCPAIDPCLTPRCEVSTGRCLYATCQPKACQRATCNSGPPRACTKTVEQYSLSAGELGLGSLTVGCSADATACFAAVYPYAFIGTPAGAVAVALSDLKSLEPPQIPVDLPFAPAQILASEDVVYFLGPVAGGKISIATVRVPSDPRAMRLSPTAVQLAYPFPSAKLYRAPHGNAFLVFADAAKGFPAAVLDPTLRGGKPIVHVPAPLEAGAPSMVDPGTSTGIYGAFGPSLGDPDAGTATESVAASSVDRLLLVQRGLPSRYALVTAVGTPKAAIGPAQNASSYYPPVDYIAPPDYETAPDGTVVVLGALRGPLDPAHFYRIVAGSWILEPSLSRLAGLDTTELSREGFEYDAGGFDTLPPLAGRMLPFDSERAFIVHTTKDTSPSGLRVAAVRRVTNAAVALYSKLVVFDDPGGDVTATTVAMARAGDLVLVLRKTPNGSKILAFDTRCQPK